MRLKRNISNVLVVGNFSSGRNEMAGKKKVRSDRPKAAKARQAGKNKNEKAELTVEDLEGVSGGVSGTGYRDGYISVTTTTVTIYD